MELGNAKPIGLDMKGNVIKKGDISCKCSIEVPKDAPKLAMVREEDKQIRKGDMFVCIKELELPNGEKPFKLGATYKSDTTRCITDENGLQPVFEDDWWHYFKRI